MSYKSALAALAIFMACGPALAQSDVPPPSASQPGPPPRQTTALDRDACGADVRKFCNEVVNPRPGDNRVLTCLIKHEKELSEACKKNVESHRTEVKQQ
jgi:hypothetical protein